MSALPAQPRRGISLAGAALLAALLAAGCDRGPKVEDGVVQTKFPGQVSAGGGTSGEVIAQSGGKQTAPPAGTPGIPQGAEGNVGGARMGGTGGERVSGGLPAGEGPQKAASATADPGASGVVPPGVSASAATSSGGAVGGMSNVPGAVAGASSGAAAGGSNPASSPGSQ
ncbi:hypothetical protein [Azohydromonas caseinilytica]|uniref:Uncharacterized protein n=1 Tax=Azohydromonas caseinilytica TaxID=2728836 RepID=A0A848FCK0_9BURK|nr:hypothetical protein [Azohydromonas caseinilytica]NML15900.1 hypothetical protein [Azohydromonas caseinilytica]